MADCFNCGTELPPRDRIFRQTLCETCGSDVRVCRNCTFFSPGVQWDCRETITEPVRDKERANFCDHFRVGGAGGQPGGRKGKSGNARDTFNSLFDD
jgi:hypothetical protein